MRRWIRSLLRGRHAHTVEAPGTANRYSASAATRVWRTPMMAITRDRMTVALALVIPTGGLAYSTAGPALGFDRSAAG